MAPVSHSLDFFIGRLIAFFQFVVEFKRFHSAFKFTFGYFGHCDVVFPLKAADAYLKDIFCTLYEWYFLIQMMYAACRVLIIDQSYTHTMFSLLRHSRSNVPIVATA